MNSLSIFTLGVVANISSLLTPVNIDNFNITRASDSAVVRELPFPTDMYIPNPTPTITTISTTQKTYKFVSQNSTTKTVAITKNITRYESNPIKVITQNNISEYIDSYSKIYNVDGEKLKKIAFCESTNNPDATNGIYGGLFQFDTRTWVSNRNALGLDTDPNLRFNPEEAAKTAAFLMSKRGAQPWPVCGDK